MKAWLALIRPGDWLVAGVGALAVAAAFPLLWRGGPADRAVIRLDGRVVAEYPLNDARRIEVPGPLGTTVVEIRPGRARVLSDPGPRQYCVKQGWLTQANAVAICAPNHVSLALAGRQAAYDSLNY
ncbi:MAG TPA: NusG domain II-containing protein [Rhodocyclaceae bacterium]|nr:NusG domain II-containing protein [Rhodocyclaceae bacterium]